MTVNNSPPGPGDASPRDLHSADSASADSNSDALTSDGGADLLSHSYDGIQEFDNPLPGWWKWTFAASIFFAFPYFAFYHGGAEGRSVTEQFETAAAANARLQFAGLEETLIGDANTLAKYKDDANWVRVGRSVFKSNCSSCHGSNGGGVVGPNLADQAFKNIRKIEDLYRIVNKGAAGGAMPAWENRLEQNERVLVAAYVASLRGTDPGPNAKGPEGNEIPPWPVYVPPPESDSADETESEEPDESSRP